MCLCVYCRSNKLYLCNTSDRKCVEKLWNQRIKLVIFHSFLTVITLRHILNTRSTMNWTLTSIVFLTGPDLIYSMIKNTWLRLTYSTESIRLNRSTVNDSQKDIAAPKWRDCCNTPVTGVPDLCITLTTWLGLGKDRGLD